jgi:hypothetical protein
MRRSSRFREPLGGPLHCTRVTTTFRTAPDSIELLLSHGHADMRDLFADMYRGVGTNGTHPARDRRRQWLGAAVIAAGVALMLSFERAFKRAGHWI